MQERPPDEPLWRKINTNLQSMAIVLGALWAAYTFVYKEIIVPKSAPAHVALDAALTHEHITAADSSSSDLEAIVVRSEITNRGPQMLYNLDGVALLFGGRLTGRFGIAPAWIDTANVLLRTSEDAQISRYQYESKWELISVKSLDSPDMISPNETVRTDWLYHLPSDLYDYVELIIVVAQSTRDDDLDIDWQVDKEGGLAAVLYKVIDDGRREILDQDDFNALAARAKKDNQFSQAERRVIMKLR